MSKLPNPSFNLTDALFAVSESRDRALVVVGGAKGKILEKWTYEDVIDAVFRVAGGLSEFGLPKGSRILMRVGNTPLFPMLFFGAIAAGYVPIPTSSQLTESEVDYILADSGAALVMADGSCALPRDLGSRTLILKHMIERLLFSHRLPTATTSAEDPAFILYTSGTTGRPKGVLHAQRAILGRRPMREGWHDLRRSDQLLHTGAFNWSYTLGLGLMDPWANGATSIIHLMEGERSPALWPQLIESTGASLFGATPSLYRRILKYGDIQPETFSGLRHALSAGELLKRPLYEQWTQQTGRPIYQALGMTEISTYIGSSPHFTVKPDCVGKSNRQNRVRILKLDGTEEVADTGDIGVLAVHRSEPGLMLGYFNKPEETAAAFRGPWFITGDLASVDAEGYITYAGRLDDQIKAFGYRVAPEEIEQAIASHPSVHEVAVTEVVEGDLTLIAAFVVINDGQEFDREALTAHCADRLADYKRPHRWVQLNEMPGSAYGKVSRRKLQQL